MSTRISDRVRLGAALAVLALLPACLGGLEGDDTGGAPAEAVVTSDNVVVTGPSGFCIDETATRSEGDTAFVLLGNCAAISNSRRAAQPEVPVVLTAAISESSDAGSISESLADLDAYFRSDEGRTLLSRTQEPESVTILETTTETDLFLLHARDTSAGAMQGVKEDYWRAYLDLGARIATLSVLALEDRGVTREQSLAALLSFVRAVRQANAQDASEEVAVADAPASAVPEPRQRGGLFNIGLFRRIFD